MRKTRISRTPDVHRMGAAMSYPGIDPRTWVSLAVALGDSIVDKDHGVYVDVQLLPTGESYSARVPADYAGKGFGFYSKIKADDDLVVVIPSGDPSHGLVVVSRLWSAADTPPQEAVDDKNEVMLVVEKDKNLRLKVSGEGQIAIDSEKTVTVNCPDIRLGDADPSDFAALSQFVLDNFNAIKTAMTNAVVVAQDGGANLKATFLSGLDVALAPDTYPKTVACETTKVK